MSETLVFEITLQADKLSKKFEVKKCPSLYDKDELDFELWERLIGGSPKLLEIHKEYGSIMDSLRDHIRKFGREFGSRVIDQYTRQPYTLPLTKGIKIYK